MRAGQTGFSFIELAVAMFIMTLLLGSILVPLGTQIEQRQNTETLRILEEARDALLGHAIANGRLPCPDTNNDGAENISSGVCTTVSGIAHGTLPWQTLGLARSDSWGNRIRYAVHGDYARTTSLFTLGTNTSNLQVCGSSTTCASSITSEAVAVLISHGKNGYGSTQAASGTSNVAPASADEIENTNADSNFVSRVPSPSDSAAGEFDDVVVWLPRYILFNKMVSAGKLP